MGSPTSHRLSPFPPPPPFDETHVMASIKPNQFFQASVSHQSPSQPSFTLFSVVIEPRHIGCLRCISSLSRTLFPLAVVSRYQGPLLLHHGQMETRQKSNVPPDHLVLQLSILPERRRLSPIPVGSLQYGEGAEPGTAARCLWQAAVDGMEDDRAGVFGCPQEALSQRRLEGLTVSFVLSLSLFCSAPEDIRGRKNQSHLYTAGCLVSIGIVVEKMGQLTADEDWESWPCIIIPTTAFAFPHHDGGIYLQLTLDRSRHLPRRSRCFLETEEAESLNFDGQAALTLHTTAKPQRPRPQRRVTFEGAGPQEGDKTSIYCRERQRSLSSGVVIYSPRAWYLYYTGANGLALFNLAPALLQSLLEKAASKSPGQQLDFGGRRRDVNSIVLLANGASFGAQAVLLLVIGAYADFGPGIARVLLLAFWSLVGYAVGFGWLAVADGQGDDGGGKWHVAVLLYAVGLVAYQLTLTYWTAALPGLARDSPSLQECRRRALPEDEMTRRYEMERSRISNLAFWWQSVGEVAMLAVVVAVMASLGRKNKVTNDRGLSALIAGTTAAWLLLSLPWFVLEQRRPGIAVAKDQTVVVAGLRRLVDAASHMVQLRQSLIYLAGYFLLGDSLNTTVTVVSTLQNQVVAFDPVTITGLLLAGIAAQAVGIASFWHVQRRFHLRAKTMFCIVCVAIVLVDGWGMAGNWTDRLGFRNVWELWLYQVLYGFFVCPWYSYSQVLISCVTPVGHEFLFFSVFNVVGKASSFVGPFISSAIIDAGRNSSAPFYFLFGLSLVSAVGLWAFLDLEESAREQAAFLARKQQVEGVVDSLSGSGSGSER
ncbi:hypothetical protein L249_0768, partial [Ophiocordyceps polyrhachis-furcata BCC 54312]